MWQKMKNVGHFFVALAAVIFYRYPARSLTVIGVTGTDGKTTTANMIYWIMQQANLKVGLISTVGAKIGDEIIDVGLHVTTPTPFQLQKLLRKMVDSDCRYAIVEATSQGLDQNRLVGCSFSYGVLTNITHEHLDYHGSMAHYVKSKLKLFKTTQCAVINIDGDWFDVIKDKIHGKIITFGLSDKAIVNPKSMPLKMQLAGDFNRENALGAAALAQTLGIKSQKIQSALASFTGVPGRLEKVTCGQPFAVIIDFAHTPNATEQVLKTLRNETKGQLIAMFGSAGLRDKTKRPLTGEAGCKFADLSIITADDPATEDVNDIIAQIIPGCLKAGAKELSQADAIAGNFSKKQHYFIIEPDRRKAIKLAVKLAKPGDTVAMLAKGHQKSFSLGIQEIPWNEKEFAAAALKEQGYGK